MDNCKRLGTHLGRIGANGLDGGSNLPDGNQGDPKRHRNYRLIIDPALKQGPKKVYSYDGVVLGESMPVMVRDPRSRMSRSWGKREAANLPVPNFKYDQHYVGAILPKEVTFCNLNNNVNQSFLRDMCKGCGNIEEVVIHFHPKSKRHLGIGMVLFSSTKSAKLCAEKFNQTTTMGNIMTVFVDALGQERLKLVEAATAEKLSGFHPPSPKSKLPPEALGHYPTPVDDFRSPKKALDTRTPSLGNLDPRGHHHHHHQMDRNSSLPGAALRDWTQSGGSVDMSTPTVDASPFRDLSYGSVDSGSNDLPPLPPEHFPYNGSVGYDSAAGHGHAGSGYAGQEQSYVHAGSRYDSRRPPHDQSRQKRQSEPSRDGNFHSRDGNFDAEWEPQQNGQHHWESGRKKLPRGGTEAHKHHTENSGTGMVSSRDVSVQEQSGDSWDACRRDNASAPIPEATANDNAQFYDLSASVEADDADEYAKPLPSLESRIQAMLAHEGGAAPFLELHNTGDGSDSPNAADCSDTNLSSAPLPPLPPEDDPPLPPLPSEDDLPPLPPEPDSGNATDLYFGENRLSFSVDPVHESASGTHGFAQENDDSRLDSTLDSTTNGVTFTVGTDDDDRMSMSSLSSGEDKVDVIEMNVEVAGCSSVPWIVNSTMHNNYLNNDLNQYGTAPYICGDGGGGYPFGRFGDPPPTGNEEEPEFETTLNEVIMELKMIMGKDMRKKMIENAAFKSLESWWKTSEAVEKNQNLKPSFPGDRFLSNVNSQVGQPQQPSSTSSLNGPSSSSSSHQTTFRAPDTASTTLASLFDNSDSGQFGVGGLLGLRGAMPKMPSFKKKFHPPSPPPVEEDDLDEDDADDDFKGPRTPEDSENEEKDKASDESSLESDGEDVVRNAVRPKGRVIYTDSSDSESDKAESDMEETGEGGGRSDAVSFEDSEEEGGELDTTRDGIHTTDEEEDDEEENVDEEEEERGSSSSLRQEEDASLHHPASDENVPSPATLENTAAPEPHSAPEPDENSEDINVDELSEPEVNAPDMKHETVSKEVAVGKMEFNDNVDLPSVAKDSRTRSPIDEPFVDVDDSALNISDRIETTSISDTEVDIISLPTTTSGDLRPSAETPGVDKSVTPLLSPVGMAMAAEHNYFAMNDTVSKRSRKDRRTSASLPVGMTHVAGDDASVLEKVSLTCDLPLLIPSLPPNIEIDHGYCRRFLVPDESRNAADPFPYPESSVVVPFHAADRHDTMATPVVDDDEMKHSKSKLPKVKHPRTSLLSDMTNVSGSRELAGLFPYMSHPPRPHFSPRDRQQEVETALDFLIQGVDQEDAQFLKRRYEELLQEDCVHAYWLNDTHWVDHPTTFAPDSIVAPPNKKRKLNHRVVDGLVSRHVTGSARTEGYYKISHQEKRGYLCHARGVYPSQENEQAFELDPASQTKKKVQQSREARSESRRWQSVLGSLGEDVGDLLKFNQLKFRKKQLKFARSGIHDWGLFALEPIQEGEMVIEYVGQMIRQSVADLREKRYEALGIGSSYLFRVDGDAIVDATKYGNLARFINHSCNPNCCAKIVTVESLKKIVIYSKRDIGMREEITYDYKFPLEEDKIRCLCGAVGCRGSLN